MRDIRDRTAAITGAASGIGQALALRLADRGCHVSLSDIDEIGLADTARQAEAHGVRVTSRVVDVADRQQVEAWADATVRDHGAVHLVFNNAGVAQGGTVDGTTIDDYDWVLGINLWGVIHGTKAFLPHIQEAGEGHIVNISSVFGLQSQPGASAYNASKFAVRGFTESLRQELDLLDEPISATCVHPGGIDTGIVDNGRWSPSLGDALGHHHEDIKDAFASLLTTSPDKAARSILAGVRRDARRVLIGLDARLLDLEQRLLPTGYQWLNKVAIRGAARQLSRQARRDHHQQETRAG